VDYCWFCVWCGIGVALGIEVEVGTVAEFGTRVAAFVSTLQLLKRQIFLFYSTFLCQFRKSPKSVSKVLEDFALT
jgi:hypothetical protein